MRDDDHFVQVCVTQHVAELEAERWRNWEQSAVFSGGLPLLFGSSTRALQHAVRNRIGNVSAHNGGYVIPHDWRDVKTQGSFRLMELTTNHKSSQANTDARSVGGCGSKNPPLVRICATQLRTNQWLEHTDQHALYSNFNFSLETTLQRLCSLCKYFSTRKSNLSKKCRQTLLHQQQLGISALPWKQMYTSPTTLHRSNIDAGTGP
jgi:hypothetical protein